MTVDITDLTPLPDDELKQMVMDWFNKLMALTFSVDINEVDKVKSNNIRQILNSADVSCLPFEPMPLSESVGEIYHDNKLVGYIM